MEIADRWSTDPFSALVRLTLAEEGKVAFTFGFPARPWMEKMFNAMHTHPRMSFGADSILPAVGTPPPSAYGCIPGILGHYCRQLKLFSLEEAVRKMTSLPSETYRPAGRGVLKRAPLPISLSLTRRPSTSGLTKTVFPFPPTAYPTSSSTACRSWLMGRSRSPGVPVGSSGPDNHRNLLDIYTIYLSLRRKQW
ncbi:MAG: hypothetical protein JW765_04085 [Deltaproteobacteria bacterium]|nr:hypothetical protein [Candidatus Zymogenaceae bacterium]